MGRKPRSESDVCDARRMRVHAERNRCGQHHGAFVDRCFPGPICMPASGLPLVAIVTVPSCSTRLIVAVLPSRR